MSKNFPLPILIKKGSASHSTSSHQQCLAETWLFQRCHNLPNVPSQQQLITSWLITGKERKQLAILDCNITHKFTEPDTDLCFNAV